MGPNLQFEVRSFSGERVVLRVYFELEARPRSRYKGFVDSDRDCYIDIDVPTALAREAADDLRARLKELQLKLPDASTLGRVVSGAKGRAGQRSSVHRRRRRC